MKNKSQFSTKNQSYLEKDLCLFDLFYLFKIGSISILTTLIMIGIWQIAKLNHQPPGNLSAKEISKNIITKSLINSDSNLHDNQIEKASTTYPTSLPETRLTPRQKLVYNVKVNPNIRQSQDLQKIVDRVINLASKKGLPTTSLSVTLIDLKTGEEASYQQEKPRYPASVVKLYWLVMLQAQLQEKNLIEDEQLSLDLHKMMKKSDNEAASRILDRISDTQSGSNLNTKELELWLNKRKQTNRFFIDAGYEDLNISQKTFPIPYLKLYSPQGRELQMRENKDNPIRNKITTKQTSRLMYEIVKRQAVSSDKSSKMLNLLAIDATTRIKSRVDKDPNIFNNVRGFFSQSLPDDIYFAAKAGWTSESRGETAYIATADQKTEYILTIFAEDRSYAHDWNIFPEMSRLVFNDMKVRNNMN
ncbi:MAG: class A beta-lactamase-related serine hydrolase [Pleurocapsa minor HA4230-MV1]|jgi:beta-lactamase class A|nr:class A beta-lactamase-related serine hydrolase [Pleurocapsa minor HA4230-MV1]